MLQNVPPGYRKRSKIVSKSFYVKGFQKPSGRWKKMKAVLDSCEEAGVTEAQFGRSEERAEPPTRG